MSKSARRLVTLPLDIDARALKFSSELGLSISAGLCMLISEALDLADGTAQLNLCNCDPAKTCAVAFRREKTGRCRRHPDDRSTT